MRSTDFSISHVLRQIDLPLARLPVGFDHDRQLDQAGGRHRFVGPMEERLAFVKVLDRHCGQEKERSAEQQHRRRDGHVEQALEPELAGCECGLLEIEEGDMSDRRGQQAALVDPPQASGELHVEAVGQELGDQGGEILRSQIGGGQQCSAGAAGTRRRGGVVDRAEPAQSQVPGRLVIADQAAHPVPELGMVLEQLADPFRFPAPPHDDDGSGETIALLMPGLARAALGQNATQRSVFRLTRIPTPTRFTVASLR